MIPSDKKGFFLLEDCYFRSMTKDELFMQRCLELAQLGIGSVAPNPMVGAVIVHNDLIIGEGYHQKYGEAHAEVNAVNSVTDHSLLPESTIYVSLEPCAHFGKTPPCADLIINHQFKRVVIGARDPFAKVDGQGIQRIKNAGIQVDGPVLERQSQELNKRFFTFHQKKRPYVILKWAQTEDGFMDRDRTGVPTVGINWITQPETKTLVHQWRTQEAAILVGKNTVINDNPQLTARKYEGNNPLRIALDPSLNIPETAAIFDDEAETLIFNCEGRNTQEGSNTWIHVDNCRPRTILAELYARNVQSVIIEGGRLVLDSFIESELWDEARVFTGRVQFESGLRAPKLTVLPQFTLNLGQDILRFYTNIQSISKETKIER